MEPQAGDIILYPVTPKSGWTSRLVAAAEMILGIGKGLEAYSHAAILAEDGMQWEAKVPRTGKYPIDKSRIFEIWNVGMPDEYQRRWIAMECKRHEGEWYNLIGLLTRGRLWIKKTEVCSQLVDMAYKRAGIKIFREGERLLSPNAIADFPGAMMVKRYYPSKRR